MDAADLKPAGPHHGNPLAGVLWMLLSCMLLGVVAAFGRFVATEGVPTFEVVFLRLVFGLLAMTPFLWWRGFSMLRTRHLNIYLWRVGVGLLGMFAWFAALATIGVGEVTAIGFLGPLFGTVGAALFLGEIVRWRRWVSTCVGFLGAMIILRPGVVEIGPGVLYAIAAAAAMSASALLIKTLADREDPDKMVMIAVAMQTAIAFIPAVFVWVWPSWEVWAASAGMGLFGMLGHITLARAYRAADASLVLGVEFARLPFAVALGYVFFGELIDLWVWVGAGVIFAAAFYNAQRERRLAKAVRT